MKGLGNKFSFVLFTLIIYVTGTSAQKTELCVQTGHIDAIMHLAISPDNQLLASSDFSGKVNIWHLPTSGQMSSFIIPNVRILCMEFSHDSRYLIIQSSSYFIFTYDIAASNLQYAANSEQVINLCRTKEPNIFLILTISKTLRTLDIIKNEISPVQTESKYNAITFDQVKEVNFGIAKGRIDQLAVLDSEIKSISMPGIKKIDRDLKTRLGDNWMKYTLKGISKSEIEISGDMLFVRKGVKVNGYNIKSGKQFLSLTSKYHNEEFMGFDYSTANDLLIAANSDGSIYCKKLKKKKRIKYLKGHYSEVYDIVFSPDQSIFASCSKDRSILIWDSRSLKSVRRLYSRAFAITSMGISSDFSCLTFGNEIGFTRTINIESTLMELASVRNHTMSVNDVYFLPGDTQIISSSNDNKIVVMSRYPLDIIQDRQAIRFTRFSYFAGMLFRKLGYNSDPYVILDSMSIIPAENKIKILAHREETTKKISLFPEKKSYKYAVVYDLKSLRPDGFEKTVLDNAFININQTEVKRTYPGIDLYQQGSGHIRPVTAIVSSDKHQLIISASMDATLKFWDSKTGELKLTLIPIDKDKKILITADNYYIAPKDALNAIGFKSEMNYFPPEQFDLKFNRPDIVHERLGIASEQLLNAYRYAYQKRLKKMNFSEEMLSSDLHIPQIEVTNKFSIPFKTSEGKISVNVLAKDELYDLDRINVWINNVPVYSLKGIDLREINTKSLEKNIEINLAKGLNRIQLSVMNTKGTESLKESFEIAFEGNEAKPNLYLVVIGTSVYKDSRFNLNYAAKDANDLRKMFEENKKLFDHIYVRSLTDTEVTKENILKTKEFLNQSGRDDIVIVFVAGHGLLDESFNYFYGTSDVDFNSPGEKGISYDELESLLDGIKALKKLLFMDTCHSGELDKDEVEESKEKPEETGDIAFRAAGVGVREKQGFGFNNTNELTRLIFADLRRGTGSTVISSSGGAEYAIEGKKWNNGLFTYCLMEALNTKKADTNRDGQIMISELQEYIRIRVTELSGGRQVPTSRLENITMDFRIW